MFDMRKTGNTKTYSEYQDMRLWLVQTLNAMNIKLDMLPVVDGANFIKVWFECNAKLDMQSLADMKHEFYEIKRVHNGFTVVEI